MLHLNALAAAGLTFDLSKVSTIVLLLILAQAAVIVIALVIFAILFLRKHLSSRQKKNIFDASPASSGGERVLVGVTLDASAAPHSFKVGDIFGSSGLVVTANYSDSTSEQVEDYALESPDMSKPGNPAVTVRYGGFSAYYTVNVSEAEEPRIAVGLELDLGTVRRKFTAGEMFEYAGLSVRMLYTREPYAEEVYDYTVEAPDMTEEGQKSVTVRCGDFVEFYKIDVLPAEVPQESEIAVAEDEEYEKVLRVDKSFTAKLIQAGADVQSYYSAIKNELLAYKKVHDRMSWKRETYRVSGDCVAKISFRGSTLCLYLPLDPAEYAESRYKVEDASSYKSSEDTPCLFRIKNEKRARLAADLIARIMEERGIVRKEREPVDYAMPEQSTEELAEQGLVRYEYRLRKKGTDFLGNSGDSDED